MGPFYKESLKELSRGTGLSITYLSRVRNGYRTPSLSAANRIAAYCGVSLDDLFAEIMERTQRAKEESSSTAA